MKILVIGGTKFFGIPMVNALLESGHEVTIATRGRQKIRSRIKLAVSYLITRIRRA